jgi:hypothetical protein
MINYKIKFIHRPPNAIKMDEYEGYIRDKIFNDSCTFYIVEMVDGGIHIIRPYNIIKILERS